MPPPPPPSPAGPELRRLRAVSRRIRRRTAGWLLASHLLFTAVCCIAAPALSTEVLGHVSAGLLLVTLQLIIVLWTVCYYGRAAKEHQDPAADRVRDRLAAGGRRDAL
ncbi:DUF485 domain-containing protein [Streptomyces sp. bgisy130]|uniref:DUF485 domain-containing protein n=1 Tax=Streptomyces sp. bgisy130 TaxID=3413788 RepID=UPI003F49F36E